MEEVRVFRDSIFGGFFRVALMPLFLLLGIIQHDLLDAGDGLSRIQTLRTRLGAVEDGVAAVKRIFILHHIHALEA